MTRTTIAGAFLALLVGCATPPTEAEIAAADIGPRPAQAEFEQLALQLLARDGLEPEQFAIEFSPVRRSWYRASGFAAPQFAWQLDASVAANSRSRRRAAGVGTNQFYWLHGRCVARAYYTRMFDGSRARTFVALDADRASAAPSERAGAAPTSASPAAEQSWIGVLLARRSTLRNMRFEAKDEPEQLAAIDLLLAAVDEQLAAAGYPGR